MKYILVLTAFFLAFSAAAFGQKTVTVKPAPKVIVLSNSTDEKAVRAAFEDLLNGIRNSNVEGVTSAYLNSPETLFYNNNGSVTIGWEQDRKNREARYPRTSNVKIEVKNVKVMMLGADGAVVACQWTQSQEFDANSESATGRMTLGFKKIGKNWKIVHLHSSPDNPPAARPVLPSERLPAEEKPLEKPLEKPAEKPNEKTEIKGKPKSDDKR